MCEWFFFLGLMEMHLNPKTNLMSAKKSTPVDHLMSENIPAPADIQTHASHTAPVDSPASATSPLQPSEPYLRLLSRHFPTIRDASSQIVQLSAMLELPKGTEHFITDLHGEHEPFEHVLRSGSGSIKRRIDETFRDELTEAEKQNLATLIYYPERKIRVRLSNAENRPAWIRKTLGQLIRICRETTSKYARNQVRDAFPAGEAAILEELLIVQEALPNRKHLYRQLIDSIIEIRHEEPVITALCRLIQRFSIARLHVVGDVYDRGPGPHIIMDKLIDHHSVDFQWGNHDIVWMGAAAGSTACICNAVRVSLRYAHMEILENGYGIPMLPLASLAMDLYGDDPCERFMPKLSAEERTESERLLMARMHKAITIMQLKLEGQLIRRRPDFQMEDRLLLDKIDPDLGALRRNGKLYPMLDHHFPTLNPLDPWTLSDQEQEVMDKLLLSFRNSEKLQKHARFLFSKGSMYLVSNGNLLYHACIPMEEDGTLKSLEIAGEMLKPREYMDRLEQIAREAYVSGGEEYGSGGDSQLGLDWIWYLWCGPDSPLFGKDKMATFERYFLADKTTHKEVMNPYYDYRTDPGVIDRILSAFGLVPKGAHIINGHVPVKVKGGESPVKAGGKLLVIDGGFAKAYQTTTGIAGYTLLFNSYGLLLVSHQPFDSIRKAMSEGLDLHSETTIIEHNRARMRIGDTDEGAGIREKIRDLRALLDAYRSGLIKES